MRALDFDVCVWKGFGEVWAISTVGDAPMSLTEEPSSPGGRAVTCLSSAHWRRGQTQLVVPILGETKVGRYRYIRWSSRLVVTTR